jgi:hypothetical protein
MRTSSQFRKELERIFGIALGTDRHDQAISTSFVCLCQHGTWIPAKRRLEERRTRTKFMQQVCSHQGLSAPKGTLALAQLRATCGKG